MKHGTAGGYRYYRCPCAACLQANREDNRARQQARRDRRVMVDGRLVAPVPPEMHGNANTYQSWCCRCADCTEAHRQRCIVWRERARQRTEWLAERGGR